MKTSIKKAKEKCPTESHQEPFPPSEDARAAPPGYGPESNVSFSIWDGRVISVTLSELDPSPVPEPQPRAARRLEWLIVWCFRQRGPMQNFRS